MKAYKVELIVVDHEGCGLDEFLSNLENMDYYSPDVISTKEGEIGEWSDDHPLNYRNTPIEKKLEFFE